MPAEVTQLVRLLESILTVVGIIFTAFGVISFLRKRADQGRGQSDGSEIWTIILGIALAVLGDDREFVVIRLKQAGVFDNAKAVIFGRTCFPREATDMDYLEQLERVFGGMDVPVIWNADIGHTKPSFTLINGAVGHLSFENGYAELSMECL